MEEGMTKVMSLPSSMQQELAARAVRACMAAEAAMASLRAECKPLQIASPQSVLSLNTKTMGNAHRSLQLQIEACESFALSATAAFKQLCDVLFCVGSVKSESGEHTAFSDYSCKTQLWNSATTSEGELLESQTRPPQINAADESSARSTAKGMSVNATDIRSHWAGVQVNKLQDTIPWGLETDAAYMRFPSPEMDNEPTSRDEIVVQRSVEEAGWDKQLGSRHSQEEEDAPLSGDHILSSEIHESDASELALDLTSEISSHRKSSASSTDSTESQLDDEFKLHKITSSSPITAMENSYMGEPESGTVQTQQATTSEFSESNTNLRESEHYATQAGRSCLEETPQTSRLYGESEGTSFQQVMEVKSPPCVSDAHSGVSSHISAGSPPPASSISTDIVELCNSFGLSELQPEAPSLSTRLVSRTMAEMNPSSSAARFSWSSETPRSVDAPSVSTQLLTPSEHNQKKICAASVDGWEPSMSSLDLPLYPAHPTSNIVSPTSASSIVRRLDQEFNPSAPSLEFQELARRKLQLSFTKENGHSTPPSFGGEDHCEEPKLPSNPSPYTLKMRSTFCRKSLALKPSSEHSVSGPLQSSFGRSEGSIFSMATVVREGSQRPPVISGLPSGSLPNISIMEKKATELVDGRPLCTQSNASSTSSTLSAPCSLVETGASFNNSDFKSSGREGSLDNYKDKPENFQVLFPTARASFYEEPQNSWGASRMVAPVCTQVAHSSLQNVCQIPWHASPRGNTPGMERCVGTAYIGGSNPGLAHISAQEQATGESCGYIQGNFSDVGAGHTNNENPNSDCRYNRTGQRFKICEREAVECNNKDFSQKPTSWRWNSDQQNEEIGLPFSRGRGTNWEVMVGGAGDCARSVSTLRPTIVINSDDDNGDEDDSSSSHREWNEILISMQQKGKRQASKHS
uniref:Uncharacterized protein n=1 Tax=Physcomitrium patens TaxID=3218 RepID=A0A2K1K458_PHYPA|nr:hypothetical protein PHYPA_013041 [Physcomitrium patens]